MRSWRRRSHQRRRSPAPSPATKTAGSDIGRLRYWIDHQFQERLSYDYFVARLDLERRTRNQPVAAIHVGAVEAPDIFDRNLAALDNDQCVLARNLGLGVVLLQVHLGKRSGLGIPASDKVLAAVER